MPPPVRWIPESTMNIYLIPYTWSRHMIMALYTGAAALLTWWAVLQFIVVMGPVMHDAGLWWGQGVEGGAFLSLISGAIAGTAILGEGALRRRPAVYRGVYALLAAFLAMFMTAFFCTLYLLIVPYLGSKAMRTVLVDTSLVTLRYRFFMWAAAGASAGLAAWFIRGAQVLLAKRGIGKDGYEPLTKK